jgi:Protein of unknown function (DUF3048) N-terminal domain/Protein of unknown function (DUF3048) C-terminal domain
LNPRTRNIVISIVVVLVLAAVGVGVVLASSGGGDEKAATTTSRATTIPPTTTTVAPPTAPLTGLPDPGGASLTPPALSVKVENTDAARPQAGLDQADVVYEEVVEGDITRFVAIFNSAVPNVVGPVRSVRAEDPAIVWPIGGIFAYSGGAPVNVDAINAAPVHAVDESAAGAAMVRNEASQPPRGAPHNLYGLGPALFALGGDPVPPPPLFQYLALDAPALTAKGVIDAHVGFAPGYDPTWTWDGATGTWKRAIDGVPQTVAGGPQIAPANVVVQFTPYTGEAEGQTVGEGDVWVFSDGTVRAGRWVRPDQAQPAHYVDAAGAPILLRPGRTWVELLPVGAPVDVTDAPVPATTVPPATTVAPSTTKKKKKK